MTLFGEVVGDKGGDNLKLHHVANFLVLGHTHFELLLVEGESLIQKCVSCLFGG